MDNEQLIVSVLKENGCYGQENMITPEQLIEKCQAKGLKDIKSLEAAIVRLVDTDVVDYEMDADLRTSELWLL
ncbi:MAG: hypothetical protein K0R98_1088 [Rickettsiaceae bacterium]|jgi:hypothetical protein|nr:hypothetical protein [Rickettsiaceae bacterium]